MTVPYDRPKGIITDETYRGIWAPQGWKLLIIGPTATWRQEWHMWEAIRDIVQNALDESEEYIAAHDQWGLCIEDMGRGVAVSDLLLGPAKAKPWYARGRYGEGMKVASLAILREGYEIYIETVGKEYAVLFYEQPINGRISVLAAMWKPGGTQSGTKFHIIGYYGSPYSERFAVNLLPSSIICEAPANQDFPTPRKSTMYTSNRYDGAANKPVGDIFIRDIWLEQIDSMYSYNLWDVALAPDRYAPEKGSDIGEEVGRIWTHLTDEITIKNVLNMVSQPPKQESWESSAVDLSVYNLPGKYQDVMKDNKETWIRCFKELYGSNAVITRDTSREKLLEYYGYSSVVFSYGSNELLSTVIGSDIKILKEIALRTSNIATVDDNALTTKQMNNLTLARAIAKEVSYKVNSVNAAILPKPSEYSIPLGSCDRVLGAVYISIEGLNNATNSIKIIIHECAHINTGSEDTTPSHYQEIATLSAQVIQAVARGVFAEQLKNIKWY